MEDLIDETVNHRRLPGEGEFPVRSYVAVCREAGYEGPWGVEVLSEDLRNRPIGEIFERAYEASAAQLAAESERSVGV
jgi:sugar phosphate isomerase/epimerase